MAEIETKVLIKMVGNLGNQKIEEAVNGNLDKVGEIVQSDFKDPVFQRGYLHGLQAILDCQGLPTFLTGIGVREIQLRLLTIAGKIDANRLDEALRRAM